MFCNARRVSFSLRYKVNQELDLLESLGVIELVYFCNWWHQWQGCWKLIRTGASIHFDIVGHASRCIKEHQCKKRENFPLYFIKETVMYINNPAEISGGDVQTFEGRLKIDNA